MMKVQLISAVTGRNEPHNFVTGVRAGVSLKGTYTSIQDARMAAIELAGKNPIQFMPLEHIEAVYSAGHIAALAFFDSGSFRYDLFVNIIQSSRKKIETQKKENERPCKEDEKPFIGGITLLSVEEAKEFPKEIRAYNHGWWWLRTPSNSPGVFLRSVKIANIDYHGDVNSDGWAVHHEVGCVRPALILNSVKLISGNTIEIFGRKWYYHNGLALLMGKPLTCMPFNADWHRKNNYEESDVKEYLDSWLEEAKRNER